MVKKLINISKKNSPIIIIYSNPDTIINFIKKKILKKKKIKKKELYFYCHKFEWWMQFSKIAKIEFYPWRSFSSQHQKKIFPNNFIGKILFKFLIYLERKYPKFFVRYFQYPIIVLKKY